MTVRSPEAMRSRVSSRECFPKTWASMRKHSAAFKLNASNGLRQAAGVFHQDWENTPPLRFREPYPPNAVALFLWVVQVSHCFLIAVNKRAAIDLTKHAG